MLRMPGAHCSGNVEDCRLQHSKYGLFTTVSHSSHQEAETAKQNDLPFDVDAHGYTDMSHGHLVPG